MRLLHANIRDGISKMDIHQFGINLQIRFGRIVSCLLISRHYCNDWRIVCHRCTGILDSLFVSPFMNLVACIPSSPVPYSATNTSFPLKHRPSGTLSLFVSVQQVSTCKRLTWTMSISSEILKNLRAICLASDPAHQKKKRKKYPCPEKTLCNRYWANDTILWKKYAHYFYGAIQFQSNFMEIVRQVIGINLYFRGNETQ